MQSLPFPCLGYESDGSEDGEVTSLGGRVGEGEESKGGEGRNQFYKT